MSDDYDYLMAQLMILILKAQIAQLELLERLVGRPLPVFRPPDLVFQPRKSDHR